MIQSPVNTFHLINSISSRCIYCCGDGTINPALNNTLCISMCYRCQVHGCNKPGWYMISICIRVSVQILLNNISFYVNKLTYSSTSVLAEGELRLQACT